MEYKLFIDWLQVFGLIIFMGSASYLLARFGFGRQGRMDLLLSGLLIFYVLIICMTAALGQLGLLHYTYMLMSAVMVFLVIVMFFINKIIQTEPKLFELFGEPEPLAPGWILYPIAASFCAIACYVGVHFMPIEHDVMTYHLFFPARWFQESQVFIIPTPFGDPAPAYAPSNMELTLLFWSLPFEGDFLARIGQFPFLIMGGLALVALLVRRGYTTSEAAGPACLALLSPVVFRQGFSAEVDLAMGSALVAALYFLDGYRRKPNLSDGTLFGVAIGFALGTKYLALTFGILLVAPFAFYWGKYLLQKPGRATLQGVASFVAVMFCGGMWYVRNLLVAGNPLFPLEMNPFFDGLYTRSAMMKSVFHMPLESWPKVWIYAYGPVMGVLAIVCLIAGIVYVVRRKYKGFWAYIILLPIILAAVQFLVVPYNGQYRFLIPAVWLSFISIIEIDRSKVMRIPIRILAGLVLVLNIIGFGKTFFISSMPVPGMGLVPLAYLPYVIGISGLGCFMFWGLRKAKIVPFYRLAISFSILFLITFFMLPAVFHGKPKQVIAIRGQSSAKIYPIQTWVWIEKNLPPSNIAYSGNNVPYYLTGTKWQHRVSYVNIEGNPEDWLHDFMRKDLKLGKFQPSDTSDKGYALYRHGDLDQWLYNLSMAEIHYLVVTRLWDSEAILMEHDSEYFPMEKTFAEREPQIFSLIHSSQGVRIYKINSSTLEKRVQLNSF